ncbi:hypothetical protein GALMADRAFT_265136 [Galerina marginata CBS 339.88]|uniref:F-box domain-containing protein n=1 Tax=Galerina marginata (strain CBS 339.88) TaxID=685588 RepID=A0A067TJ23_GALM3|nr:hypothetical protein GALMADRAFT_265136 [Galerina marginata CBS 339.88]
MASHYGSNSLGLPLSPEIHEKCQNQVTVVQRGFDEDSGKSFPIIAVNSNDSIIDSALENYKGATTPLSSSDAAVLNSFKAHCTEEIDDLIKEKEHIRKKIVDLCCELGTLCQTLKQKKDQLDLAQSLKAPIRCLPPEVLNYIFEMCLPFDQKMTSFAAPLLLCQVSRQWRDIATQNPMLWNSLSVDVPENIDQGFLENRNRLLNLVLERSKGNLLSLEIQQSKPYSRSTRFSSLLDTYSQLFPRCRDLEIWSTTPAWFRCFIDFIPAEHTFSNLTDLSFNITHNIYRKFTLFQNSPKLDVVAFNARGSGNIPKIVLPYPQLEIVNYRISLFESDSVSQAFLEWREFLRHCENLYQLEADFTSKHRLAVKASDDSPTVSFTHNHLITLYLDFQLSGSIDRLLQGIHMPCLEMFGITGTASVCQINLDSTARSLRSRSTMSFNFRNLSSSFQSLKYLTLRSVSIEDEDIFPIFSLMTPLRSLFLLNFSLNQRLHNGAVLIPEDTTLVRLLTQRSSDLSKEPFLPNLVHLTLSYPYHREKHPAAIPSYISMVRARCEMNRENNVVAKENQHIRFQLDMSFNHSIIPASEISSIVSKLQVINTNNHANFEHWLVDESYMYEIF